MRVIRIENLKDDMVLARPLFQKYGIVLLNEGATNLVRYKEKFKQMGIFYLYVEDDESRGIEIDDVVKQETRNEGRRVVGQMLKKLLNKQRIHMNEIQEVVTSIIDDILTNKTVIVNLTDLKNTDDYLYGHAVNVSVLALIIGHAKGYSEKQLMYLGTGAILHDIGLALLPEDIVRKPEEKMTSEEKKIYRSHPKLGYETVKNSWDVDAFSKLIIWGHHECLDGTGYPRGLKGNDLHEMARIVAVCDAYDELTSNEIEPGKKMPSYLAMEYLSLNAGIKFDAEIIELFLKHIATYPVGSMVTLNDGRAGIVEKQNEGFPMRPVVRLLNVADYAIADLTKEMNAVIVDSE